jgi:ATP-dependent DNA ligase
MASSRARVDLDAAGSLAAWLELQRREAIVISFPSRRVAAFDDGLIQHADVYKYLTIAREELLARLGGDGYTRGMLTLINPVERVEPFDHADWVFEAKFDGFRAAAGTVRGR